MLVFPVCPNKKSPEKKRSHGYWKDLLNILALAATDSLHITNPEFLHHPRGRYLSRRNHAHIPIVRIGQDHDMELQMQSRQKRVRVGSERSDNISSKLNGDPKFRALFIAVARLFGHQLIEDIKLVIEIEKIPSGSPDAVAVRRSLLERISLAGKWAPTPGAAHDRVTNIATVISLLLHNSRAFIPQPFPRSVENFDLSDTQVSSSSSIESLIILRSYYQRWFLTRIRNTTHVIEPLMCSNRWSSIRYGRVPSRCMDKNTNYFFNHDQTRFTEYLADVEMGKAGISGATLFPHELIKRVVEISQEVEGFGAKGTQAKLLRDAKSKVVEGQWNAIVQRLKESGTLENCIAVCDVSGSMGSLWHTDSGYGQRGRRQQHVPPILPAISLSLLVARLAKPPFSDAFITFSRFPEFVTLDPNLSLHETVVQMSQSSWGMNTDFSAVFLQLILPIAKAHRVPKEEMIKRIFVFSDMQFDAACNQRDRRDAVRQAEWKTNHDVVVKAYEKAGYDVPQIVYWDLEHSGTSTVEVEAEREGVAMMNGFSGAMMKVFTGEEEETQIGDEGWEEVNIVDGEVKTKTKTQKEEFTPLSVMKKTILKPCYDGLVVMD
ncbi:hypothetical protein D9758_008789 [Tetrapyrgos nigripes]|uniref:Uncharacterized protein n=1 Tax=Tetrapyrgos nigripes TaxID=182062 RepID=A0A8H5D4L3_9AGAR|nr:hypothetical protein D9758_008789 [Tetrapyrgos nigripes]